MKGLVLSIKITKAHSMIYWKLICLSVFTIETFSFWPLNYSKLKQNKGIFSIRRGGHMQSSFCSIPAKTLQNLLSEASKVVILCCGCDIIKTAKLLFISILNFEPVKWSIQKRLFWKKVSKTTSFFIIARSIFWLILF